MKTIYLQLDNFNQITRLREGFSVKLNGRTYEWSEIIAMTDDQLAMLHLSRVVEPIVPDGYAITNVSFYSISGSPKAQFTIERADLTTLKANAIEWINRTRDTYLANGFLYNGVIYQSRPEDWINLASCGSDAAVAIANGAQRGNYRWFDPQHDFGFIAQNNTVVKLDAYDMRAMYQTGSKVASKVILYARYLKDRIHATTTYEEFDRISLTVGWPDPHNP
jgi:hypothetical protein